MRRVTMIEEMFNDVATREERLTVDELYRVGNKGSAIVLMVKRIRKQWNVFVGKTQNVNTILHSPRTIKINQGGTTRLMARI